MYCPDIKHLSYALTAARVNAPLCALPSRTCKEITWTQTTQRVYPNHMSCDNVLCEQGQKRFHTFGDSHASSEHSVWTFPVFAKPILTNHIGPKLMHSFAAHSLELCDVSKVCDGDWVCFCFGEIDTRCHVNRFVSDTRTYEDVINTLVAGYVKALLVFASRFECVHVCVFQIPPPTRTGHRGCGGGEYYPRGTDAERVQYTAYFNTCLRAACAKNGFGFIYAYDEYADSDGFLLPSKSDGFGHMRYADPIEGIVRNLVAASTIK